MLDEAAWHTLGKVRGLGPKAMVRLANRLSSAGRGAADLIGAGWDDLKLLGIPDQIALRAAETLMKPATPDPGPKGTTVVTPEVLRRLPLATTLGVPSTLWCLGNRSLLTAEGIAIAGSRDAHLDAIQYTKALVDALPRCNIVAGHAAGIDMAAHDASLSRGGTTTAVLAEGLSAFLQTKRFDGPESDILLVSEFAPEQRWTRYNAMARNRTIALLGGMVVIVAAGKRGGSWEQGRLCIKEGVPLFVPDFPETIAPGNRLLIAGGATPLPASDPSAAASAIIVRLSEPSQLDLLG